MTVVNPKSISGITSITTASGSDNLLTIHTSDANNTERFRINANGRIGINESSPLGKLHVKSGDSGATVGTSADELVLESADNAGVSILSATDGEGAINFGDSDDNNIGKIAYNHSDNDLFFKTSDVEKVRITSNGSIGIGTDNPQQDIHILRSQLSRVRIESTSTAYNSDVIFQNPDGLLGVVGYNASLDTINIDSRGGTGGVSFTRTGSERVRIAADGKVGIGTTNPEALLHLVTPNADCEMILEADTENDDEYDNPRILFRQDGGYDQSCVGIGGTTDDSSIHNCLTLRNSTGSAGGILLMTNNQTAGSGISNHLHAVTRLKVTSTGNVEINTGNIHIGTAGKGVYFGNQVTTSASGASMSSELLDHYEEGSWTPVLKFGGGSTGITYSARDGSYTRIGRQVTVNFMIEMTSKGSSTGTATITGLPFPVDDLVSNTVIEASGVSAYWNNFEPDMYFFGFTAESTGGGQLTLRHQPESGAGDAVVSVTNSTFQNDSTFRGSITYFTDT
tara:strand:- start:377 stop:1906 length:1530 start_codon:yes stop_codon:yes gene_type:complete